MGGRVINIFANFFYIQTHLFSHLFYCFSFLKKKVHLYIKVNQNLSIIMKMSMKIHTFPIILPTSCNMKTQQEKVKKINIFICLNVYFLIVCFSFYWTGCKNCAKTWRQACSGSDFPCLLNHSLWVWCGAAGKGHRGSAGCKRQHSPTSPQKVWGLRLLWR